MIPAWHAGYFYKEYDFRLSSKFSNFLHMESRRDFLKKATLLSSAMGMSSLLPAAIQRALAIEADPGTTWKDAEHIVILMQENRSFDHTYGTLRGVRGFNDPRAIRLANNNPVWLQSNRAGETYAPFRLDFKGTKATWMSSLPHAWSNQVDARNDGKYDQWLNVKKNSIEEYSNMPLTLGYHTREDIPFYYALADGFTVCDQNFCSSLTGTTPNRLYFWTGTIRAEQNENSRALVWNDDADYESLSWRTFPELLEEHKVSWKCYQNEVSVDVGFDDEEGQWLANFGDNPLEYFAQYNIRLHGKYMVNLKKIVDDFPGEIAGLQKQADNMNTADPGLLALQKTIAEKQKKLDQASKEILSYSQEKFDRLTDKQKSIHRKAFVTNQGDPDYHSLETITFQDNGVQRTMQIPKGDLLHQFRTDVQTGNLPTISWLTAPEHLSDHPSSAWYGAWYVSEVMDILTQNPEVWKKTIFILAYDENDGYFDHIPPFTAPHSGRPETGKVSQGIDTRVEYVTLKQEEERKGFPEKYDRESSIGLGFRVPLVIASPWSKGGYVNSEVFDHTSTIQFIERFIKEKKGIDIRESNISSWRRVVCGDLTSAFRPATKENAPDLKYLQKQAFLESVYKAKFKGVPTDYKLLSEEEIKLFRGNPYDSPYMPVQEKGVKPSCGLNYQLYADGQLSGDKTSIDIYFEAGREIFGDEALGSPFNVYAPGKYLGDKLKTWAVAVKKGDRLKMSWPLQDFENGAYHLRVYGPNGFYREFKGTTGDPEVSMDFIYEKSSSNIKILTGNLQLLFKNPSGSNYTVVITDNVYGTKSVKKSIPHSYPGTKNIQVPMDLSKQFGWYDFTVHVEGFDKFEKRYAGRVETGRAGFSDPYMGRMI